MKRILVVSIMLLVVAIISACGAFEEPTMYYEGKLQPVTTVEEIIADKLEVENPEMDIEVDIYEESEDE